MARRPFNGQRLESIMELFDPPEAPAAQTRLDSLSHDASPRHLVIDGRRED